ncbi:hypothetical protein [Streptomyces xylophagus]|uniref:hypothetical protein n=1 Tax=Streptomyces xylophagus TaxID=285514 RepID=UPI000A8DA431|nr:hypothetical protein [Streptomyces xylophagus]
MVKAHGHGTAIGPDGCRTDHRSLQDQWPAPAASVYAATRPERPRIATDHRCRHQVAQLTTGTDPVILTITHHGPGHFVVDTLDEALQHPGTQLAYTDGPFACRSLINADDRPVHALRVEADGPWTIETASPGSARPLDGDGHARRPASDVLRYEGGPAIATLSHEGYPRSPDGGYFLVDTFAPDGHGFLDELANHVGRRQSEAPLPGPCLVYTRSDGPWSISVRPLHAAD